jgi:DNA-binding transcriptional LysR family regulator
VEIYQLRYFLAVAQYENFHQASASKRISVGSLTKAVSMLEAELGVKLFKKIGRNIRLTGEGNLLLKRAIDLIAREESIKLEVGRAATHVEIVIAGADILLTSVFTELEAVIKKSSLELRMRILELGTTATLAAVEKGEAHIGVVFGKPPSRFRSHKIKSSMFKTCLSEKHDLAKKYSEHDSVPVSELLTYPFVTLSNGLLGPVSENQSNDGWRDDKFPRKILYTADGLRSLEILVRSARALAYLPDYYVEYMDFRCLTILGCPYKCEHEVYLVALDIEGLSVLKPLFHST